MKMNAIVYRRYGPPELMHLEEVDKPTPAGDQVLVKVYAVSVNAPDWRLMRADPFLTRMASGLLRPRFPTLGCDIAGRVEAAGPQAEQLRAGEDVFGELSAVGFGGFAEYACVSESALARKPASVSYEVAAAAPLAALTALQGLRDHGRVRAGDEVLIAGASGGVGTFAVQIAKLLGAVVTAVCSTQNVDLARALGADHVVDYTKVDFAESERRYDVIFAVNGVRSIWDYRRTLARGGRYLMVGGEWPQIRQAVLWGPVLSLFGDRKLGALTMKTNQKDLAYLGELLETGKVKPVIDRRYPLSAVPDAISYVEEGHARGKVIIQVAPSPRAA